MAIPDEQKVSVGTGDASEVAEHLATVGKPKKLGPRLVKVEVDPEDFAEVNTNTRGWVIQSVQNDPSHDRLAVYLANHDEGPP